MARVRLKCSVCKEMVPAMVINRVPENPVCEKCSKPAPYPTTEAAVPGREPHHECYALIEVSEDGEESATFYSSQSKRDEATLKAIWFGGPDESHKEEAEHCLETLREKGILTFEGDPPLKWATMIPESELLKQVRQARVDSYGKAAERMIMKRDICIEAGDLKRAMAYADCVDMFDSMSKQAREEGK